MSYDKISDLTAGVYFLFFTIQRNPHPVIPAIGVSHTDRLQINTMSFFDEIFDLTAGVVFFYI